MIVTEAYPGQSFLIYITSFLNILNTFKIYFVVLFFTSWMLTTFVW